MIDSSRFQIPRSVFDILQRLLLGAVNKSTACWLNERPGSGS